LILVDTSVWVDYFNGVITEATDKLDDLLGEQVVITGDLIIAELLQGFHSNRDFQRVRRLMEAFPVYQLVGYEIALRSAQNYHFLRKKGVTVRKTIDMLIGTYCIVHDIPLLHSDRDFTPLMKYLGLTEF
jgi:hypothetical protein